MAVLDLADAPAAPDDAALAALEATGWLHPEEVARASAFPLPRRGSWVGGRLALRHARRTLEPAARDAAVLATDRGGPLLPPHLAGSISHKGTRAMALLVRASPAIHAVGVDVEERPAADAPPGPDLAPRILTAAEQERLAVQAPSPRARRDATLVAFALKEAVYKAIDPVVRRYVRFTEVEVALGPPGPVAVRLLLPDPPLRGAAGRSSCDAPWPRHRPRSGWPTSRPRVDPRCARR
jgi:enterobactin synthetase component D